MMTDFVPDSVWIYAGSDGGWTDTGEWSCDVEPDCAHYWPHVKMLTATPVRLHAEELVEALREVHRDLLDMRLTLLTEGEDVDPRIKRVTDILTYFLARVEGETND